MKSSRTVWILTVLLLVVALVWYWTGPARQQDGISEEPQRELTIALNDGDEGRAIKALAQQYPAARVEVVELPYQNLREKLGQTLRAGRSTYDLIMLDDPWFPELSPHLLTLDPVPQWLEQDLIPASLALGRLPYPDGETRALAYVGNCQLLFYRSDLLQEVGWDSVPSTWDEVLEVGEAFRSSSAQAHGYCVRARAGAAVVSDFLPVLWSLGGNVFEDPGNPQVVVIGGGETKEALELYRQLVALSPPGAAGFDYPEMLSEFAAGNAALELTWPAAVKDLDQQIPRAEDGSRRWGVALPPRGGPEGRRTSMAGNWLLGIPSKAANSEAAKELLLWLFEHQLEAAQSGNPPTRRSVYENFAGNDEFFHYPILLEALEQSTPRPRTKDWARIEDVISEQVTAVITGQRGVDPAVNEMQAAIEQIVDTSH